MKIQILDLAKADLIEDYHFYEQCEVGLGEYFLTNLYADIDGLAIFGGSHTRPYLHFHRALSKRLPFAIYYTVDDETVKVSAIVDCRRQPSWIRKHLGEA